jgi:non-specific protein-tyrosine kinase
MMTSGGADVFKAAIRRSAWLVVLCAVIGAVAVNGLKQAQGPRYAAGARVLVSIPPLSQTVAGTVPPFVDPQRVMDTAQQLAGSSRVYQIAAAATQGKYGNAGDLSAATSVGADPNTDILSFTASSKNPGRAVGTVNAVANAYIRWSDSIAGDAAAKAIAALRARLSTMSQTDPSRPDLETQLSKLRLVKSLSGGDLSLVTTASSAGKTTPRPVHDTILGLSIGLVIGLLLAALREAIDTKVRSETDVESLLEVPVLAAVPTITRKQRIATRGRGASAETYALLASNVVHIRDNGGAGWNVLAVTSAIAREGKTTTAANLAFALAQRGLSVCLADFDFRKPMVGEVLGIPSNTPGAIQVLDGSCTLNEALWEVSLDGRKPSPAKGSPYRSSVSPATNGHGEPVANLLVLPAGGTVSTQDMVQSRRFPTLLDRLRKQVEFVILDTPPALLTVEMSELAASIDAVLVVVRQGHVAQRSLRTLRKQASGWSAELVGAVLTDTPAGEGYSSSYGRR